MTRSTQPTNEGPERSSRRGMLKQTAAAGAAVAALGIEATAMDQPSADPAVKNGRIKQSIVYWCFEPHWDFPQAIKVAKQLGCVSIELVAPKFFPLIKQAGLTCAIGTIDMGTDPPFVKGFNNPKYREHVIKATRDSIDACADHGFTKVICFTGMREGIPDDVGANNCVEGFKQIVGHAEKKGVTLCLEMLNSRVTTHPMKGHPGYQGDHTDYCIDIIKRVGSPSLKLLFDIYHVQIMDGDIISRIRQHRDDIAHVHTAGNPGRGELDNKQEINYPPIMEALLEIGYQGHVGQEFIPTRDPIAGLHQAVALCDV
ncbi:MAG: hydroxypyruvate isomerase family protein [Isosphaeraceae bacterium]